MADPTRLKRTAMRHRLAGCCAVGVSLAFGAQAYGAVSMTVATNDGVQGASLTLTWSLTRTATDPVVAGAGLDIIFDTTQMQLAGSCAKDPRLTQQGLSAELPLFSRCHLHTSVYGSEFSSIPSTPTPASTAVC